MKVTTLDARCIHTPRLGTRRPRARVSSRSHYPGFGPAQHFHLSWRNRLVGCRSTPGSEGAQAGAPTNPSQAASGSAPAASGAPDATAAAATNVPGEVPFVSQAQNAAAVTPAASSPSSSTHTAEAAPAATPATAPPSSPAAAASPAHEATATAATAATTAAASSSSRLPQLVSQLLAWLGSVGAALGSFPLWVQMQHLRRLREACDEDPKDADKHAAYLAQLVKTDPKEVIARVESRQFGTNAAVVAEYLQALVATGKVAEYARADAAAAAADREAVVAAANAAAAGGEYGGAPRSLSQLLKEVSAQLEATGSTAAAAGVAGAGGAVGAVLEAEVPGASVRRPLHVVVSGVPGGLQAAPRAASSGWAFRPLQLLWSLVKWAVVMVILSAAFLSGSQAIRRVQASGGFLASSNAAAAAAPSAGGAGSSVSGVSGGPAVDPKEYKKDELPEKSIRTFKDVKGCDEAKEELREVVEFLKNPTKFTKLGAKLPKGVLLSGPPGTGKTLLARAVAGEAGVPFFYRAGSEFEELYVGVGSRRMRALFAAAKKRSPCIVFIDEIDAIGGNRKHWENHTRKTLNQLLVEMDGFESTDGIIVMAATNLPESLDPALKRPGRFDRQVAVALPDIAGRRDILNYYLEGKPVAADVDRELLARQTQGFSGADLSNLVNEAAILAATEGKTEISQALLDSSFDKVLMGVERKSVKRTLEARRRTAFHEAGHALVALLTPGASPIHKATIVPRGHALGMVTQVGREDEFSINRQQMTARIAVCMGGTVAEELVFGEQQVSSGATDDLRQATNMARHMVAECGMSPAIGPVFVPAGDERHGGASEATRRAVDGEVAAMLVGAKEQVKRLLASNMQALHTLANALLDKETLTREEITALLQLSVPGMGPPEQQQQQPGQQGEDQSGGLLGEPSASASASAAAGAAAAAATAAGSGVSCTAAGGPGGREVSLAVGAVGSSGAWGSGRSAHHAISSSSSGSSGSGVGVGSGCGAGAVGGQEAGVSYGGEQAGSVGQHVGSGRSSGPHGGVEPGPAGWDWHAPITGAVGGGAEQEAGLWGQEGQGVPGAELGYAPLPGSRRQGR